MNRRYRYQIYIPLWLVMLITGVLGLCVFSISYVFYVDKCAEIRRSSVIPIISESIVFEQQLKENENYITELEESNETQEEIIKELEKENAELKKLQPSILKSGNFYVE